MHIISQNKRTKVIATIGPASQSEDMILALAKEGVDVCRINFSHDTHETHQKKIDAVHHINKKYKMHLALLGDLQGPKLRVGKVENDAVVLKNGTHITITTKECIGTAQKLFVDYPYLAKDVKTNDRILIDDGKIMLRVLETNNNDALLAQVVYGGTLSSRKGFNLPDSEVSEPTLSEKDKTDLAFIMENRFQWVALSFVRRASDIHELRNEMAKYKKRNPPLIIAKIEKPEALTDINNIIEATDAVMVARGDLGIEIPMENVPLIQKMIINKCLHASKPIIVATQMMESMIHNFNPTRAEVSDVANSVMDGADAVMLSGETSVGDHPLKVVEMVRKIIKQVESFEGIFYKENPPDELNSPRFITDSVIYSACILAQQVHASAIVSMTHSGYSAIKISSHRPKSQIFVFTNNHAILSKLSLVWGVKGFYYDKFESTDNTIDEVKDFLVKNGYIEKKDIIINLASMPIEARGKINMVRLSYV